MTRAEPINIQTQITITARAFGIKPQDITGPSKRQKFVQPRKSVWLTLICEPIGFNPDGTPIYRSLPAIARHFNDRDHTTVLYGVRTLSAELYGTHPKASLAEIRQSVQAARQMGIAA